MTAAAGDVSAEAAAVLGAFRGAGWGLALAESVTGGCLAAALTAVPGASEVFRGGVVAYSVEAKVAVLGVDPQAIRDHGLVSREVALRMAQGAATLLGAQGAAATTGAAGPGDHGGAPAGRVWVAAVAPGCELAVMLDVAGGRSEVMARAVREALRMLCDVVDTSPMRGTSLG